MLLHGFVDAGSVLLVHLGTRGEGREKGGGKGRREEGGRREGGREVREKNRVGEYEVNDHITTTTTTAVST